MGRNLPTVWTLYRCPDCGTHIEIQRQAGLKQKAGHLKWLWCHQCRADKNCQQLQEQ